MLIPYILWTLLYSAVSLLRSREWCGAIPFLLKNLLTGKAASPLYYIVLLLQLELLLPVLIKLLRRGGLARGILWMITPLYMVYVYIHCFIWGQHPPLYGTLFPAYLIFYLTGLEASCRKEYLVRAGRRYGKAVWIVITLGVSIVEGTILSRAGIPRMAVSQLKCSSFLYSGTIILFLLNHYESREKATKNPYHSILNIVGNDSYGIFYLHCLILKIEIAVGKRIAVTVPWFVTVLLYCSITVLICEGVIYCVRHIAKITYIYTSKYTCNNKCKHKRKYIGEGYLKYIGF